MAGQSVQTALFYLLSKFPEIQPMQPQVDKLQGLLYCATGIFCGKMQTVTVTQDKRRKTI